MRLKVCRSGLNREWLTQMIARSPDFKDLMKATSNWTQASTSSKSTISLEELRFYTAGTNMLTGYDAGTETLGGQTSIWDMDAFNPDNPMLHQKFMKGLL